MKTTIGVLAGILLLLLPLYLAFWPVPYRPMLWTPGQAPDLTGILAPNSKLKDTTRLGDGLLDGPEDVAIDRRGLIYGGLADGTIMRLDPSTQKGEIFAKTGGRPLGLHFDQKGNLIVADAVKGLLSINSTGEVTLLTDREGKRPFAFTDDVDVGKDGMIYFSDATDKYPMDQYKLDILEHGDNGRLLSYDPKSKETRLLLDHLYFANGVAVSSDQNFVLVAETSKYRVRRFWLNGPKKGQTDIFIDNLPGFPDGISSNGRGLFWLAIFGPRDPLLDFLLPRPFLRKILFRLPQFLLPKPKRYAFILGLDEKGGVVHNLQDPEGSAFAPITNIEEHEGNLYLGGLYEKAVGMIKSPQ